MKDIDIKKIADYSDDIISKKLLIQGQICNLGGWLRRGETQILVLTGKVVVRGS